MAQVQAMKNYAAAAGISMADDKFSDFTIVCGDREFKVHRFVISTHSRYFEACCSGKFKEGYTQRVELHGDPPEVVERMVSFFYTFNYNDKPTEPSHTEVTEEPSNEAEMNAWVYTIAEKYDIQGLKALAMEQFWANTLVTDASHMLGAAATIFKRAPVPPTDKDLKHVFCFMWFMGGEALIDNIGTESLVALNTDAPEFTAMYLSRVASFANFEKFINCSNCTWLSDAFDVKKLRMPEMNGKCRKCSSDRGFVECILHAPTPGGSYKQF